MSSEWLKPSLCSVILSLSLSPYFSYRRPPVFQHFDLSASNTGKTSNSFSSVRWALSLSSLLSSWHFPVACDFWQQNMSKALYQTSKVKVMQYKASRQVKLLQNVRFARLCTTGKAADPLPFFKWKVFFLYWDFRFTKMSISYCHAQGCRKGSTNF